MLCLTIKTNLMDPDDEPVVFGPYSFLHEEAREDWMADWELAIGQLNAELLQPYVYPHHIEAELDEFEGMYGMAPAPPVTYLIDQLRQLWNAGIVSLVLESPTA